MRTLLLVGCFCLLARPVFAEDVAQCQGTAYLGCRPIGDSRVWLINPNDITTPKPGYFYQPNGCAALLPGVSDMHRICRDTNADTVPDVIEEMTQAEKDAVNAPILAEQARQAAFNAEVSSNDLCSAELTDLTTRIDAIKTTFQSNVETSRLSNKTSIQNAANLAALKTAMVTANDSYANGFVLLSNDLATVAKKTARCVRARAR
jgi:hypothetical protein